MIPADFDEDIHTLLKTNALSLPVHRGEFIPPSDLAPYKSGYITWSYDEETTLIDSEGHANIGTKQMVDFYLDVTVFGDTNAKRKSAADAVLDLLQPVVSGKRTFLTSQTVGDTFFNFVIYRSSSQIYNIKTGQSTVEVAGILMSFSCRVTI